MRHSARGCAWSLWRRIWNGLEEMSLAKDKMFSMFINDETMDASVGMDEFDGGCGAWVRQRGEGVGGD